MIVVNGTQFTESDILSEMQYHPSDSQREAMIKAGESLVISELLRQRAKARGIAIDKEGEFTEALFAAECKFPQANEQECLLYFEQNRSKFTTSPLLEIKHILLPCAKEDDLRRIENKELARNILGQLQATPGQFDQLVEQYSKCPSSKENGFLGQVAMGQTVPEFERQVFQCEPGLISTPIESRYGYHIVLILNKIEGKLLDYSMVKNRIAEYLNEKVKRRNIAHYIDRLIAEAEIEGFDFKVSESPLLQ